MKYLLLSSVLTILGIFKQVESFSPNKSVVHKFHSSRTSIRSSTSQLKMADPSKDLTGKIVAQRYIYRFSLEKSAVSSPYAIEERQYYSVAEDRSLEPFGSKHFIFRDWEAKDDIPPPEETLKKNGTPRMYTRIGKALYTVKDLNEDDPGDDGDIGGSVWDSSFALALYCMAHPEVIRGKGIEIGR